MILAGQRKFNWRCWLTAAIANCPSRQITSAKMCRPPSPKKCVCGWTFQTSRTRSCWQNNMSWNRKHLLDIESLTADEIVTVLDTAKAFKAVGERAIKKVPALRGKTVVNLFIEPSTRTRISFELAAQRLTADIVNFSADASSFKKGETLKDAARNLEALNADFIVIRHSASGAPHFLSRVVNASIINAGDGAHEHPTQALLDAFTIREHKGKITGLNVTILGDILYSRVARSNIWALTKLGAKVTLCGPS